LEERLRHRAQPVVVRRPAPRPGGSEIGLPIDEGVPGVARQHKARPIWPPFVRHGPVGHPQAEEVPARIGNVVVNLATLAWIAELAPDARGLVDFRERIDFAAHGAAAAFAAGRGPVRRERHGHACGGLILGAVRSERYPGAAARAGAALREPARPFPPSPALRLAKQIILAVERIDWQGVE